VCYNVENGKDGVKSVASNKISVNIDGRMYSILGTESEEYLRRVGGFVNNAIKQICAAHRGVNATDAAVLAALSIADDLLKLQDENLEVDERIRKVLGKDEVYNEVAARAVVRQETSSRRKI